jgi:hypothetical protein
MVEISKETLNNEWFIKDNTHHTIISIVDDYFTFLIIRVSEIKNVKYLIISSLLKCINEQVILISISKILDALTKYIDNLDFDIIIFASMRDDKINMYNEIVNGLQLKFNNMDKNYIPLIEECNAIILFKNDIDSTDLCEFTEWMKDQTHLE